MSITMDVVNLRFNVTPDYKQQIIQQMKEDLSKVQREAINTRKELDNNTQSSRPFPSLAARSSERIPF